MSHDARQSRSVAKSRFAAVCTGLVCAASAWAIHAGGVLAAEPVDLTEPLPASQGALAVAVQTDTKLAAYKIWPEAWTQGSIAAGTPCATGSLPGGVTLTKRIEANGKLRRCVEYNSNSAPPANAVRPLPPMPMDSEDKQNSRKGLTAKAVDIVTVISWPAEWTEHNSDSGSPAPYAGQPCSDFALFAGETTYKHIQTSKNQTANHRCVPMTKPIYANGP
jgi:hypothetical protein